MSNPLFSIVTTLYRSETFLNHFVLDCIQAMKEIQCENFELVFVNDGSPDNSINVLFDLKKVYNEIVIIDLSRNFGHHNAIMAGLNYSKGDYVFLIDCDLEISPTTIPKFYDFFREIPGCDVVYGVQDKRKGSFLERKLGDVFYFFFNGLSEMKIPNNLLTERLMSRKYVNELIAMGDKNIFMGGIMQWIGFTQVPLVIKKNQRVGKSTYTFKKRIDLSIQAVTSFSSYPLILLFRFGFLISLLSLLTSIYFLIKKILFPEIVLSGFTFLIVAILFSTGLILSSLGIIGIYIDKLFNQTKNRPTYIIRNIYK